MNTIIIKFHFVQGCYEKIKYVIQDNSATLIAIGSTTLGVQVKTYNECYLLILLPAH